MIQCPECSKDIADDSAHCGYCGAKIEAGSGKKTMMGFAAVTSDSMREMAEEMKRVREEAAAAAEDTAPAPQQAPSGFAQSDSPVGGQTAPTPQHGIDARQLDLSAAADDDAPTEMMAAVSSQSEEVAYDTAATTDPDDLRAPATVPTPGLAAKTKPELAFGEPSQLGVGFPDDGPSEFGSGKMQVAQQQLPEKKNNNKLIIAAVVAVPALAILCCVGSQVVSFLLATL